MPCPTRTRHKSHLAILPSSASFGAPTGQTSAQLRQPVHKLRSTSTTPSSAWRKSAPVGQICRQDAFLQFRQAVERKITVAGYGPCSWRLTVLKVTPPACRSFWSRQATTQAMQPEQSLLSKSITRRFCMVFIAVFMFF